MIPSTNQLHRSTRVSKYAWGLLVLAFAPGCSICCQPYLDDYVAFGSRVPRSDMKRGRVGSPFSDPDTQTVIQSEADLPYYEGEYYEGGVGEVIEEGVIEDARALEISP